MSSQIFISRKEANEANEKANEEANEEANEGKTREVCLMGQSPYSLSKIKIFIQLKGNLI
jgi:hypothetical protein